MQARARGAHRRLWPANIRLPEEELPVEVGDVNRVEVDHVNVAKAHQREVLEELAAEAAGADDEHARHRADEAEHLRHRLERHRLLEDGAKVALVCERAGAREQLRDVREAGDLLVHVEVLHCVVKCGASAPTIDEAGRQRLLPTCHQFHSCHKGFIALSSNVQP